MERLKVGTGVGGTADAVTISAIAQARQMLDAAILGLRRLGALLDRLDQVTGLDAPGDPTVVIGLAAEVGAAAQDVGRSFAAEGDASGPTPGAEPLGSMAGVPGIASASPGSGAVDSAATLRAIGDTGAPATAARRPVLSELQPTPGHGEARGDAAAGTLTVRGVSHGDHRPSPAPYARAFMEIAAAGPTRAACTAAAGALLQRAAAALALAKLRLLGTPAPQVGTGGGPAAPPAATSSVVAEVTRYEAQVALAMARVASSRYQADPPDQARSGGRDRVRTVLARCGASWPRDDGEQLRLARAGFVAILLCAAAVAMWIATTLDLTLARIACAVISVMLCLAGTWRAVGSRLPSSLSIARDPDKQPFL